VLHWGFVIPRGEDMLTAHVGVVTAIGREQEVRVGERVIYSARTDTFKTDDGTIDIVEENSVLGVLQCRARPPMS
jgi:hypothetical protein